MPRAAPNRSGENDADVKPESFSGVNVLDFLGAHSDIGHLVTKPCPCMRDLPIQFGVARRPAQQLKRPGGVADKHEGSPARRGRISARTGGSVIFSVVCTTSATEKPRLLPRLTERLGRPFANRARRHGPSRGRSHTWSGMQIRRAWDSPARSPTTEFRLRTGDRRSCRVIWRTEDTLGVEFTDHIDGADSSGHRRAAREPTHA
jgi:hypothetical protein